MEAQQARQDAVAALAALQGATAAPCAACDDLRTQLAAQRRAADAALADAAALPEELQSTHAAAAARGSGDESVATVSVPCAACAEAKEELAAVRGQLHLALQEGDALRTQVPSIFVGSCCRP